MDGESHPQSCPESQAQGGQVGTGCNNAALVKHLPQLLHGPHEEHCAAQQHYITQTIWRSVSWFIKGQGTFSDVAACMMQMVLAAGNNVHVGTSQSLCWLVQPEIHYKALSLM